MKPSVEHRGSPGFTLVEVLIAVGAFALLAVALASIFEATGRTVTGGRRVSAFNNYASLIEQRMRRDFDSMTRDGFLVVRNQISADGTGTPTGVSLFQGDRSPRPRRTDEIVFFAEGEFLTAREPMSPAMVAKASAARIYYGHGERALLSDSLTEPYLRPEPDDTNYFGGDTRLGAVPGSSGIINPNRYASDWTLLRHVTLLRPPQTAQPVLPNPFPFGLTGAAYRRLLDSDIQVSLQPAASGVFRSLALLFPDRGSGSFGEFVPPRIRQTSDDYPPQFSSGLVDISTMELSEIRMIVNTASKRPDQVKSAADFVGEPLGTFLRNPTATRIRMQRWMRDAFPTDTINGDITKRVRMRYEPVPTDLVGVLRSTYSKPEEQAWRIGDQMMLTSSNFLPHCTEFIVEWTFGLTYPSDASEAGYDPKHAGELIWYGLKRDVDGVQVANPYRGLVRPWEQPFTQRYPLLGGGWSTPREVTQGLIHGLPKDDGPRAGAATSLNSYFGYVDPGFDPETAGSASPTLPWAWPTLFRVTLNLADPNDPTYEQTFQFIFKAPGNPES